jgi:hypothetical protein
MSKRPLAAVAIIIAVAVAVLLATQSKHATAQAAESIAQAPPTTAQLVNTAITAAAQRYGESAPTGIEEAASSFGAAVRVLDPTATPPVVTDPETGKPWAESKVDVISMHGHFAYGGPSPVNRPAPTGTALTVIVEADTGAVVSESLSDTAPDMSAVNPTVTQWEAQ